MKQKFLSKNRLLYDFLFLSLLMDLSKKTYLELIELRENVNGALNTIDERTKVMVYSVYSYEDYENYLKKETAEIALKELIADEEVVWSEDGIRAKISYVDEAHLKYCKDYKE